MNRPTFHDIIRFLSSNDYQERFIGEYWLIKTKYDSLHRVIIKREAGKLDFAPNCDMNRWQSQASAMGKYLYELEIRAEIENIDLERIFTQVS